MNKNYGGYESYEFVADYYDVTYNRRRDTDIAFFIDYSRRSGGRTLELGCGTGRVLITTAREGFEITGLDLSPYMLQICREKLAAEPPEVRARVSIIEGDMTAFSTGERYSLVTIPFRPFQHLITVEEQKACLKCIREHLEPDGKLVFDLFNPDPARLVPNPIYDEEQEDLPEITLPDGRKVRRTGRTVDYHRARQYNDTELIYYVTYPDGRQERQVQQFPMRYFYRYEMQHLLELCGFRILDLFGDFDCSPYADDSPEIIIVAEKA